MARPIKRIAAEADVVKELRRRSRATTSAVREQERADIVLARLDGLSVGAVAEKLGTTPKRVSTWSKRFEKEGLAGLERPARSRAPTFDPRSQGGARHHRGDTPAETQDALEPAHHGQVRGRVGDLGAARRQSR
jgi:transposase-like protein